MSAPVASERPDPDQENDSSSIQSINQLDTEVMDYTAPISATERLPNALDLPIEARLSPHIIYKIQYRHEISNDVVYTREDENPIFYQRLAESSRIPIIEHITDLYTTTKSTEGDGQVKDIPDNVVRAGKPYLKINSPAIINAMQSVVDYYPDQDFSGSSIQVEEPYSVLVHFEQELSEFREKFAPSNLDPGIELCERKKNTYEHLGVLQQFLQERYGSAIRDERQRHARGYATFEMLWLLYKPGTTVYCDPNVEDKYNAYVVQYSSGGVVYGRATQLELGLWFLDYDGDSLGRRACIRFPQPFRGEKEITKLDCVPIELWKANGKRSDELEHQLVQRGKMFFKLASRRCMHYDGMSESLPKEPVRIFGGNRLVALC